MEDRVEAQRDGSGDDAGDRPEERELDGVLDVDPETEVFNTSYEITSYGADYDVDGLVRRLNRGDIEVPSFDPTYDDSDEIGAFQRGFVWGRPQMDRFVESLLLGLPVPGIFLVRDRQNKLLVLDGQQRLKTLQFYYKGHIGDSDSRYRLRYVQPPFAGRTYEELEPEDRRRLDDSIIHATVLRQEAPAGSQDAIYSIFERLNTGGSPLQPQEIRVALFRGKLLASISQLNKTPAWRALYGNISKRLKDQEMILRVLALYEDAESYARPVTSFLNHYLEENDSRDLGPNDELWQLFVDATEVVLDHIGNRAFRPVRPLNAAVVDSLMVAIMRRLTAGPITEVDRLAAAYQELMEDRTYQGAVLSSTAAEESVDTRLRMATEAFADIR